MKNFIFDAKPKVAGNDLTLIDDRGKKVHYKLQRVKNNGCILSVDEDGVDRDSVVFTMQDLKALYCLLSVNPCE